MPYTQRFLRDAASDYVTAGDVFFVQGIIDGANANLDSFFSLSPVADAEGGLSNLLSQTFGVRSVSLVSNGIASRDYRCYVEVQARGAFAHLPDAVSIVIANIQNIMSAPLREVKYNFLSQAATGLTFTDTPTLRPNDSDNSKSLFGSGSGSLINSTTLTIGLVVLALVLIKE